MSRPSVILGTSLSLSLVLGGPAWADHTNPRDPVVPTGTGFPASPSHAEGDGTWTHIANFPTPAGAALSGSGTDHKLFVKGGDIYAAVGSLGQGNEGVVGQRFFRLTQDGQVDPTWVADHGSAACTPANQSVTGLQHDQALLGTVTTSGLKGIDGVAARSLVVRPEILLDSTDAGGRCHDSGGGGLELIDISRIEDPDFEPREIHLIRFPGFSHTVTVDDRRPYIVYSSSSDFSGRPWIDVVNARPCLDLGGSLASKRTECRPKVYRLTFQPDWSRRRNVNGNLVPGTEAACHDITSRGSRLYCAGLNATLVFDVSGITKGNGALRGERLACPVIPGTSTGAAVTDCGANLAPPVPQLEGWKFLGTFNHPGRSDGTGGTQGNTNVEVPSDEGVAVAHEADPTHDGRFLFVTDERGGGVIPPGASCTPGLDNPIGNGGVHVLDITKPSEISYEEMGGGGKAVWISDAQVPSPSFCTVHVIEHMPKEDRLSVAYYTQGIKIVDHFRGADGRWTFRETASLILPNTNAWAVSPFRIVDNPNGTRTYFLLVSDIGRGVDVVSWTGPKHADVSPASVDAAGVGASDVWLSLLGLLGLPAVSRFGRRRRSRA